MKPTGSSTNDDGDSNEEVKNRFNKQNNISTRGAHFFNTILCRHSMTTTWNSLTGRLMEQEDVNTPPLDYEQSLSYRSPYSDTRATVPTRKWQRGRARALPLLNLKKKRHCSQSTPSRVFLSPSKLRFRPHELNFSEIYLVHLTFQESWNNRDKLWNNAEAF